MKRILIPLLLILALLLGACGAARGAFTPTAGQVAGNPTPTPFLPMTSIEEAGIQTASLGSDVAQGAPATGGDVASSGPVWGRFAAPSLESDIELRPPAPLFAQPEDQITILVMGSDLRPNTGGYRTDVMMLVVLDRTDNSVSLVSFPRDLYVFQPGYKVDRINSAQARAGWETTADTIEYNFGVRPDHYMLVHFNGFQTLVDSLGGIDVQVGRTLTDDRDGPGDFTVQAGTVHMDGETALWYVRSRGTSSDFDRTRRQQEVIQAIFYRLLSLDAITNASSLYEQYKNTVQTDLTLSDILPLLPFASAIGDSGSIERYAVGADMVTLTRNSVGASILIPDWDQILPMMAQALNSPQ
jgi:LCP family protein required for cell wall assembly